MPAILFGSIGTIADTSELQREAFNQAFEAHGLGWRWDREEYLTLLEQSGGEQRIAEQARSAGRDVDAAAVHRTKSELFQQRLAAARITPRPGVVETIRDGRRSGMKIALVTTTAKENVAAVVEALGPDLRAADFDLIVDASQIEKPKPDPAAYTFALERLGEDAQACVAIEDNLGGVEAATVAGLACAAFPNENTAQHDFARAERRVDELRFDDLRTLIPRP